MLDPRERNKDKAWKEGMLRYYSTMSMVSNIETDQNYKVAAGTINETDYSYILNPYGLKDNRYKKYPAKLINFDFISPIFQSLISEFSNRPFAPVVYNKNSNFNNEKQAYETELIDQTIQQKFVNTLIKKGLFIEGQVDEQGNPIEEPLSPEAIQNKVSSLKDRLTIEAQNVLDYVITHQKYFIKYRREFYDFIVANKCASFKTVINDEVVRYTVINSGLDHTIHNNMEFLDDAAVVRYTTNLGLTDIIDVFGDEKNFEEIYAYCLANYNNYTTGGNEMKTDRFESGKTASTNHHINSDRIRVQHIQFTSYKEVADIIVGEETITIDRDYIPFEDQEIEYYWVAEKREGWVIDNHFFIGGDPVEFPTGDNKNNYTGKLFMNNNIEKQLTLPYKLAQYQEAYNVCKFKIQYTFNKNKDKIGLIPLSLLTDLRGTGNNKNIEFSEEVSHQQSDNEDNIAKNLYYADSTGLMFIDDSNDNIAISAQLLKSIDMGVGNTIEFLIEYAKYIKAEAEELVGFNRFRKGDINSSDAVGNTQQGQYAGSLIVKEYFDEFEEYIANDLEGTINLAKYAYKKGKRANFIRSDGEMIMLNVTGDFQYGDYGMFVSNSSQMQQTLDLVKSKANEFLQNGKASTFLKIITKSSNFSTIIADIENAEAEIQQQAQAEQQNMQQIEQMKIDAIADENQKDRDLKKYEVDERSRIEELKLQMNPDDEQPVNTEVSKNLNDTMKNIVDEKKSIRDSETRKYAADKTLEVAKENKNI